MQDSDTKNVSELRTSDSVFCTPQKIIQFAQVPPSIRSRSGWVPPSHVNYSCALEQNELFYYLIFQSHWDILVKYENP